MRDDRAHTTLRLVSTEEVSLAGFQPYALAFERQLFG